MLSFKADVGSTQDHVYYSASLVNSETNDDLNPPECRFLEQRQTPLITDASQFYFSVIRFTANGIGRQLPLFIPVIQTGQHDRDLTIYSFSLEYTWRGPSGDASYSSPPQETSPLFSTTVFIRFVPEDLTTTPAQDPFTRQEICDYYYIKNYGSWVSMCNDTIREAFFGPPDADGKFNPALSTGNSIVAQLNRWWALKNWSGARSALDYSLAPTLSYNPTSGLFAIEFLSQAFQTTKSAFGEAALYMNHALWNLFANFETRRLYKDANRDYLIVVSKSLPATTTDNICHSECAQTKHFVSVTQDRVSTDQEWSPISEFVFQSVLLPTAKEEVSPPVLFGNTGLQSASVRGGISPQITDLAVEMKRADDNSSFLYYVPSSQYRLIDLGTTHQPISTVDIQLFWRHRLTQELYPVYLTTMSNVSIKIAFIRKSVAR